MHAQKFRELVLQALFSLEMGGDEVALLLSQTLVIPKSEALRGVALAKQVFENRESYDQKISSISQNYEIGRIPVVEKNILRYAQFEIEVEKLSPLLVTGEAVRLARKFSRPEAGGFIHALLLELYPHKEQAAC